MSFRLAMWIFMAVLAITTADALPRTLLRRGPCRQVCKAARNNNAARIEKIDIEEGPDFCSTCTCSGGDGWTPMHVAARSGCHLCIDHLMTAPFNCDKMKRDVRGNSILHIGAQYCRTSVVEEAVGWYGLNIDHTNDVGDTALCIAASQNIENCGGVARNLLNATAEDCIACANGKPPCNNTVHPHVRNVLKVDGACSCP